MEEIKKTSIHPWVYTIIPIIYESNAKKQWVLFCAYCKACRTYFTEKMPYNLQGKGMVTPSTLPRYGCEPISEDVTKF